MNQPPLFCPNPVCPASGVSGQANIRPHAPKDNRWRYTICHHTFVASRGTAFYRKHTAVELMVIVLTLITNGCPVAALFTSAALAVLHQLGAYPQTPGILAACRHFPTILNYSR